MPSPYDLIQRAKQQRKKEEGNKRADRWATLQVNTAQDIKPVAKAEEAAPPQPPAPPRFAQTRSTPNIDAIHKRHEQALKNANWQKVEPPEEERKT